MSWWVKSKNQAGQIMSVHRLKGKYEDVVRIFGEPHKVEKFNNGKVHTVEWRLSILGTKFTIRVDSNSATQEHFREKGVKKYTIPDVYDKLVNEVEVIGNNLVFENILHPLLWMLFQDKVYWKTARNTITYVFEEMEKK